MLVIRVQAMPEVDTSPTRPPVSMESVRSDVNRVGRSMERPATTSRPIRPSTNASSILGGTLVFIDMSRSSCGSFDRQCDSCTGASGLTCTSGECGVTCETGLTLSNGACYDLGYDESNCGAIGTICKAPTANGVSLCNNEVCTFQCNAGFSISGATCIATSNDVNKLVYIDQRRQWR